MKKFMFLSVLLAAAFMLPAEIIDIETLEKRNFQVNEEIKFQVTAWEKKNVKLTSGTVTVQLKDGGSRKLGKALKFDFSKGNPQTFTAKLSHPGFILAAPSALKTADGKTINWLTHKTKGVHPALGGAAVEPEKITAGGERPADFDQFWQSGLEAYKNAKVEIAPAEHIKRPGYKVNYIKVNFADGSGAIDGYLSIPEKPGKYPAVAAVPGAGAGSVGPFPYWRAPIPTIELVMNVHNFPTAKDAREQGKRYREYNDQFPGKLYFTHNSENRDEYIYRKVWLAFSRAIDYVAALPEFDGQHFAATGNSQGGGTALVIGSLNKNITCIVASVPALCDHHGWKAKRAPGWPNLHSRTAAKADSTAPYFDAAFFADNIKVPTLISVGYVDTTCPPSSVFAAYNRIRSSKSIFPAYRGSHTNEPAFVPIVKAFLKQELSK